MVEKTEKVSTQMAKQTEAWHRASEKVRAYLHFASSFTTTIRTLKINEEENLSQGLDAYSMNSASKFLVGRLLNAPSILAPFYFLSRTFKSDKMAGQDYYSRKNILSFYKLDEISAVLALTYVFHRLRRVCDPEEWGRYSRYIHEGTEIGCHIGQNFTDIGLANGLLYNGMRYLSQAIFLKTDIKLFKNYRRDVKIKKRMFDLKMEQDIFGFTHVDVGSILLQSLGFGVEAATSFRKALTTLPTKELDKPTNSVRIVLLWTEALHSGSKPPAIRGEDKFFTSDEVIDRIVSSTEKVIDSGSEHEWLAKGRTAISRKLTPELYPAKTEAQKSGKETEITTIPISLPEYAELPNSIRSQFSEESFMLLSEEIVELLDGSTN